MDLVREASLITLAQAYESELLALRRLRWLTMDTLSTVRDDEADIIAPVPHRQIAHVVHAHLPILGTEAGQAGHGASLKIVTLDQ
ncbi:hypothetical protein A0U92_15890 [Acetobacter aceti]|uniref:Uncharacterized protein n=2 Tax=Acetobacter aceti TaxID=435 RepID=A0A1U9KJT3_ACEAC|nr:hypothetical protein A0U92_15890 [Acetobacter aceti]